MKMPPPRPEPGRTELTLFRASDGDCILIRCLEGSCRFNVLVDAGRAATVKRLKKFMLGLPESDRKIDLLVVTHIDADHIAGAIALAKDDCLASMIRSIWFNGSRHLSDEGGIALSTDQGDEFTEVIERKGWAWNDATAGTAILRRSVADSIVICESPRIEVQILGPLPSGLAALAEIWPLPEEPGPFEEEEIGAKEMGIEAEPPDVEYLSAAEYFPDNTVPNGSSIAFLLRHGERRVLICADSHAETLVDAVDDLFGGLLEVDVATLPHHGSRRNTSLALADRLSSSVWTVSTEGGRHHFPHGESIARILVRKSKHVRFVFNSSHEEASRWRNAETMDAYAYSTVYRADEEDWISVNVGG